MHPPAELDCRMESDNSVGKVIENLLRNDLIICDELGFAPLDDTGAQLLFRFVAAAYERRSLGIGSHWPFESWGRFLPEHATAVSLLDRLLHHCHVVITDGDSYRMKQSPSPRRNPNQTPAESTRGAGLLLATGDLNLAVDKTPGPSPGFPYQRHHRRTVQQVFGV
jgi:hypothetical protein